MRACVCVCVCVYACVRLCLRVRSCELVCTCARASGVGCGGTRGVLGRVRDKDNQSQTDRDRGINIAPERTGKTAVDKSQQKKSQ